MADLSEDARLLALYLLTCPHSTIAGVFRLPDGYGCEDLRWSPERLSEGFAELFRKGFAKRCETTKWTWIVKFLQWNPLENPNQRKSAARLAEQIPDACAWKLDFMRVCGPLLGVEAPVQKKRLRNPSETLSESGTGAGTGSKEKPPCSTAAAFERFWLAWPKRQGRKDAVQAFAKINPDEGLLQAILAAVERNKRSEQWRKDDGRFIPMPATWLRAQRWDDELGVGLNGAGGAAPWQTQIEELEGRAA